MQMFVPRIGSVHTLVIQEFRIDWLGSVDRDLVLYWLIGKLFPSYEDSSGIHLWMSV